jgi:HK97 family phage portal protein
VNFKQVASVVKSWFGGPFTGAQEGQLRPGYGMGELGSWFRIPANGDGWQNHLRVGSNPAVAAVQSAIGSYISAMTVMPIGHYKTGGTEKVLSSAFTRWARSPTGWQTFAEWISEGERSLMETGNAVALCKRNDRTEIVSLAWAQNWSVHTDPVSGAVFYALRMPAQFGTFDSARLVPARDVMHMRINVDGASDALRGRSPLVWCAAALATNATLSAFLVHYLSNRASPSYALTTETILTVEQMRQLRAAWDEQTQVVKSGGTPILGSGLKPVPLGVAPGDALLVDTFNMSIEDVARAFGLPKSLLGVDETASNAQTLARQWVNLSLGGHVEMWEQALEKTFQMGADECVEFDTHALLRLSPNEEATRLKELVVGSILSSDEARAVLSLPAVEGGFGKVPTAQQQQVPLDLLHSIHAAEIASKNRPPAAPAPAPAQPTEPTPAPAKEADGEIAKALVVSMFDYKRKSA